MVEEQGPKKGLGGKGTANGLLLAGSGFFGTALALGHYTVIVIASMLRLTAGATFWRAKH